MPRVIQPEAWVRYTALREQGYSIREASKRAGFSESAAHRFEQGNPTSTGIRVKAVVEAATLPKVKTGKQLRPEAAHALECFKCFRLRYFGRTSTPWQLDAAEKMVDYLAMPERVYVVVNVPPGSGKSTLFTHDLLAWLAARNRNIRCMIGSITETTVRDYTRRLRNTFERTVPDMATSREIAAGLREDAVTTLQADFGRFKPERQDRWQERSFVIATEKDQAGSDKEVSFAGFGADSKFIGGRYDVIIWDDLEDVKTIPTLEQREQKEKWFEDVAEARLEPGGLFILQGQRLHADDMYRWALNQKDLIFDLDGELAEDQADAPARYKHIIYKAHYPELCSEGSHKLDAPAWPNGCLLDPKRLSWRFLAPKQAQNPNSFAVVYQQEDVNPAKTLVRKEWIEGGKDENGEYHPGCKDQDRGLNVVPKGLAGRLLHIVTADPSPTKYWCLAEGQRVLTSYGEVPIERVRVGDHVLTRAGYKPVLASQQTGHRQVLDVRLSNGRTLRLTPEHRVWTRSGWLCARDLRPGALLSGTNPSTRPARPTAPVHPQVLPAVGMPVRAMSAGNLSLDVRSAAGVDTLRDIFEMGRVDARRVAAQMVNRPLDVLAGMHAVGQAMREQFAAGRVDPPVAVAISSGLPFPAAVLSDPDLRCDVGSVERDLSTGGDRSVVAGLAAFACHTEDGLAAFTETHVVSVTSGRHETLYDISVADQPEFSAEGVIVHNSVQSWCYAQESKYRYLLDHLNQALEAPDFLGYNLQTRKFYGVLEDWWQRSVELGHPIEYVIVEEAAAQRYLLQYDHVKEWQRLRRVRIIGHATHRNKADAKFGVQSLGPVYRDGLIRLPWGDEAGRQASMKLISEVTRWHVGSNSRDDCVMAQWFLEWQLGTNALFKPASSEAPRRANMPRWMGKIA